MLCSGSSARPNPMSRRWAKACCMYLAVSGFFITMALVYTGGLQGTGDTRSPLYITLASQVAIPIGLCSAHPDDPAACSRPTSGSRSSSATSRGASSACCASARASGGTSRWKSRGRGPKGAAQPARFSVHPCPSVRLPLQLKSDPCLKELFECLRLSTASAACPPRRTIPI